MLSRNILASRRIGVRNVRCFSSAVHDALLGQAARFPAKDVLRVSEQDIRWNIAQLKDHSEAFATGLKSLGIQSGDSVTTALKASGEQVAVTLGGNIAGVNNAMFDNGEVTKAEVLKKILKENNSKILVVSEEDAGVVYEAFPELLNEPKIMTETLSVEGLPSLQYIIHTGNDTKTGMHRFRDILCYHSFTPLPESNGGSITLVDATSGAAKSTLTEADLIAKSKEAASGLGLKPDTKVLLASKSSPSAALAVSTVACITELCKLVVPASVFSAESAQSVSELEDCTAAVGDWSAQGMKSWSP